MCAVGVKMLCAVLVLMCLMLTDEGEGTLPITLPPTPQNMKMVKWGNRIDNYYKPLTWLDVELCEGVFYQKCRMEIFSISETEGIVCSLNLNNGGFYAQVHKRNVQDLAWAEIIATITNNQTLMHNLIQNFGYKFPQVISNFSYKRRLFVGGVNSYKDIEGLLFLNGFRH